MGICDTYSSFNGSEPTVNDLLAIFGRIQRTACSLCGTCKKIGAM